MRTHTRTKVVIINGVPQSGKDTFANLVKEYCDENECANVLNLSSVDPIKEALVGFGWDGTKTDDVRSIISSIKRIWVSAQNGPTMFMMNNILNFHMQHIGDDNIVFCHIREPEEIKKLVNIVYGMDMVGIDVLTLLVIREGLDESAGVRTIDSDNPCTISDYPYDLAVYNNGHDLAKYREEASNFVDELLYFH